MAHTNADNAENSPILGWIKKTARIWTDGIRLICLVFQAFNLGHESASNLKTIHRSTSYDNGWWNIPEEHNKSEQRNMHDITPH